MAVLTEIDVVKYPFSITLFFIPEFVSRMRGSSECVDKPSSRQSITMSKLLLPAYLRKGYLSFEDLVDAAVLTSRVENQPLAEKIARMILLESAEEVERTPCQDKGEEPQFQFEKEAEVSSRRAEPQEFDSHYESNVDVLRELSNNPDVGVGPGEDALLKSDLGAVQLEVDEKTRMRLREIIKEILLKLGREYERRLDNSRVVNVKPYEPFEDPELIDEDRSLENILDQGKQVENIRYDDFLMREMERKRRSIIYVQDISNTMFYSLRGISSIQFSILCLVPLLYALRRENYGLVLYESNSHVLKSLGDEVDYERLMDILISLLGSTTTDVEKGFMGSVGGYIWGGTVPNMSLRWAVNQLLEDSSKSDRLCFIFSDFVFDESSEDSGTRGAYEAFEKLVKSGVRVAACVSPLAYSDLFSKYSKPAIAKLRSIGCEVIETYKPMSFLEEVQRFIESQG
ncbi:hypothetical protein KEJ21_05290 [Candidatus Bathyarchaeota archaeon]|nr:hypothetical protein [Candidatus Bathyarchaeota archaeon]MBS7631481.1 hypothetical protein [Candidatus Bathyarchaeota archaeon]